MNVARKMSSLALMALTVTALVVPAAALADDGSSDPITYADTMRVYGNSHYGTMAAVVGSAFSKSDTDTVIITSSAAFSDALSAAGFAGLTESPILITDPDETSHEVLSEIDELDDVKNVVIVGGKDAVSENVADDLRALDLKVSRIGGTDRFDSAVQVYNAGKGKWDSSVAYVVSGVSPSDALSISPVAWTKSRAVFLADEQGNLPQAEADILKSGTFSSIVIVGGTAVVSQQTQDMLEGDVNTVTRIAGANRFETSYKVASYGFNNDLSTDYMYFVEGGNDDEGTAFYKDALFTGAAAGEREAAMILVDDNETSRAIIKKLNTDKAYIVGGTESISDDLMKYINDNA